MRTHPLHHEPRPSVTIMEVAHRAKVSIATVSRVINQNGYVAPAVQDRVRRTVEALDYQPSALARGLRRRQTQSVGVLVPKLSQPFFSLIGYAAGEQFQLGFASAQQLLRQRFPPTAIIALTDMLAVGVLHGAWKAGLQLPADLSVTGFDNIPLASHVLPELTTVAQPVTQMGERAVHRLLRLIRERLVRLPEDCELKPESVVLPTRLIVRSSTAPPRAGSAGVLPPPKCDAQDGILNAGRKLNNASLRSKNGVIPRAP